MTMQYSVIFGLIFYLSLLPITDQMYILIAIMVVSSHAGISAGRVAKNFIQNLQQEIKKIQGPKS